MATDLSSKTVCVFDNGLFTEVASAMVGHFGRVLLCVPWESAYPKSNQILVGRGLEGIEKIDAIWPYLHQIDLFVFPDVYHGPLQEYLVSIGKRVWGSKTGEDLELNRVYSKEVMRAAGQKIGPYQVLTGMDALRKHLKKHDNQYVKVSRSRGDFETFKAETYQLAEPRLDDIEHRLGAKKTIAQFVVETAIPDAVEVGYDGYSIDGQFPGAAMYGIEVKDKGYIGHFRKYSEMAEPIREVNAKSAPLLKNYQYRNFWSAEARITKDGTPWVIDPCCRAGSPPSELATMMYTNLAEIMWHGAAGELIDPKPAGEWGAQVMLVSSWANEHWQAIDFPPEVAKHVKLHFPVVIDDRVYVTPMGFDLPAVGAVVAVGKTLEQAVAKVKEVAEQVRGFYVEAPVECFDAAQEEMTELKDFGIEL